MLVRYKVKWWNDGTYEPDVDGGVVCGETLGDATDKAVDFYGKDNVVSIEVYECNSVLADDELEDMIESCRTGKSDD